MPLDAPPAFPPPPALTFLLARGLLGPAESSPLRPWYHLGAEAFWLDERWPAAGSDRLSAFARRKDTDDIACFKVEGGEVVAVVVAHGWTSRGYDVVASYETVWDWLKSVIDDLAELVD